jgi:uncharacterized protein (UPF0332 family)
MTGRDFLTFAKTLYALDDEAARRTSISRAYYALYHHVRECLVSLGIPITTEPKEHQRMVRYLKNSGIDDAKYVGEQMNDIREKRNNADYKLSDSSFNKNTCDLYCSKAETLFDQLDSMDKQSLKNGLIQYAKLVNEPHS